MYCWHIRNLKIFAASFCTSLNVRKFILDFIILWKFRKISVRNFFLKKRKKNLVKKLAFYLKETCFIQKKMIDFFFRISAKTLQIEVMKIGKIFRCFALVFVFKGWQIFFLFIYSVCYSILQTPETNLIKNMRKNMFFNTPKSKNNLFNIYKGFW